MADSTAEQDNGNGRVRQARWQERVEAKLDTILAFIEESRSDRKQLHLQDDALERCLYEVQLRITKLEERQGVLAALQATWSAVASAIAGAVAYIVGR